MSENVYFRRGTNRTSHQLPHCWGVEGQFREGYRLQATGMVNSSRFRLILFWEFLVVAGDQFFFDSEDLINFRLSTFWEMGSVLISLFLLPLLTFIYWFCWLRWPLDAWLHIFWTICIDLFDGFRFLLIYVIFHIPVLILFTFGINFSYFRFKVSIFVLFFFFRCRNGCFSG